MTDKITIAPTFEHAAQIAIVALENGTPTGKAMARAEILRHARELDRLANGLPARHFVQMTHGLKGNKNGA